jgi:hypothetical protein
MLSLLPGMQYASFVVSDGGQVNAEDEFYMLRKPDMCDSEAMIRWYLFGFARRRWGFVEDGKGSWARSEVEVGFVERGRISGIYEEEEQEE